MTDYVNLTIDDIPVQVPKGTTVYTATQQLGIDIPIFCYQDRMPPFGACRVCLVEVEKMGKLQTSCTLECTEGMVVRTQGNPAVKAREEILEFLLINHPLDCPICDRGGECPLQDQAVKFGPGKSRFYEDKRHFTKPLPLGPVLMLDRERCIACARCTRFGDIVAGDHALEFIERGYKTEVGTADGKEPKSKYIGNTIMICPVGALTSEVYRFRARPWDNLPTKSTCTLCPVGCSMILDSRDGEIMRTRSEENRSVNDIWLCDKGWFGYEFSSSDKRLTQPLIRKNGTLEKASWDEAFSYIAQKMQQAKATGKIAALGGSTLTVEENYLLQSLMRDLLGSNNVDYRVGEPILSLDEEGLQAGCQIAIGDTEELSGGLLLGLDITEEFPVIWLRIKQAINRGAKFSFLGHYAPEIARYMHKTLLHAPDQAVGMLKQHKAELLASLGPNGALLVGRQYLASHERKAILQELLSWQREVPSRSLNLLEGRGNSMGSRLAGMHPELLPNGKMAPKAGLNSQQLLQEAAQSGWELLYVVGADVAKKSPSSLWQQVRSKLGCLVVQDLFMTQTAQDADVVLPTLSFVEKGGSFLNIEARVQKLKPGKSIPKGIYADSYIFARLAQRLGKPVVIDEPFLELLKEDNRILFSRPTSLSVPSRLALDPGALQATFTRSLFDNGVRMKENTHLVQLAKCPRVRLHPKEAQKRGLSNGSRITIQVADKQLTCTLHLDEKVAEGTIVIPLGFDEIKAHELGLSLLNGLSVKI